MLRNYLIAALRNLVRNRLYAAINIVGLAVGFAVALLIALFVRDELTFDRYFPDYEQIYLVRSSAVFPGLAPIMDDGAPGELAKLLKLDFPSIEKIGRFVPASVSVRRSDFEYMEPLMWADAEMLEMLKFRPVAGDLGTALAMPDSIVLTRAMARKYFGRDNPVGETLELDRKIPFTVTAVIEDLPSNVNHRVTIIAAGHSGISPLAQLDAKPPTANSFVTGSLIYMRLADHEAAQRVATALPDFLKRHKASFSDNALYLVPIGALHFAPVNDPGRPTTDRGKMETIVAVGAIGILIVFAASINFVNLMTARAGRRATEVGVRKVTGAARADLIVQFIGESLVYVVIGMALALLLTASLLPTLNLFLDRTIAFDLLSNVQAGAFLAGLALVVGLLAGIYPALVLSSFRPAVVLKAGNSQSHVSTAVRKVLVVGQFALLIGLLIATGVIYRQIQFALTEAQRLDTDQVVIISHPCSGTAFKDAVSSLPGVRGAVCGGGAVANGWGGTPVLGPDGQRVGATRTTVDAGFFAFYGLSPVAGRFFSSDRPADTMRTNQNGTPDWGGGTVVLNETAVRRLGFASPSGAIGQTMRFSFGREPSEPSEIVGVVPDYAIDTIHAPIQPIVYFVAARVRTLNVRLDGARIPETLQEIDRLWKQQAGAPPINRYFLSQDIEARYRDIIRQGQLFAASSGVAIFIALLGLFGMAAFTAEQRTKEIGIRKAMGASKGDILRLLLWQFTKPVLWANLIAWPVAGYFMKRWLEGFAYRVDLEPAVFLGASAAAVVIAMLTVIGHALLVARSQPATALRYE